MENRFASVGKVMKGDSYVHRKELEERLLKRTVKYDDYGSVNLVGLQRMGKSSLVYNTLVAKADEFYTQDIVVAKIAANEANSANLFFKNIAEAVYEVLEDHDAADEILKKHYEKVDKGEIVRDGSFSLKRFFKYIKKSGKRVVLIIDEFDHSTKIFSEYPEGFNVLRELAYEPETDVAFVFVSRRLAEELESKCEGISPFHNILEYIYVKGFSDEEMEDYHKCNEKLGVVLNEEEKETLKSLTGRQPYWSDKLLKDYKYVKDEGRTTDLETVFNEKIDEIYSEYEHMLDLLEDQGLKNKLYQLMFGPIDDCTNADIQTLYNYGVIIDKEKMTLISDKLYKYMEMKESEVKFNPLWYETETKMRRVLKPRLEKQYGKEWEDKIKEKYLLPEDVMKKLKSVFFPEDKFKKTPDKYDYFDRDKCKTITYTRKQYLFSQDLKDLEKRKNDMRNDMKSGMIRQDADISMFEALYTKTLFFVAEFEYNVLSLRDIFDDRYKFVEMAAHLRKVRNICNHSNEELLTEDCKKKTREYCRTLCKKIDEYEEKNN